MTHNTSDGAATPPIVSSRQSSQTAAGESKAETDSEHGALLLSGIGKRYGGVPVLRDVDLTVEMGKVHGLVGENGAGKSTLMRILAGVVQPDSGTMVLAGRRYAPANPRDALTAGATLISQEISLVPELTVLENVFLGTWTNRFGVRTPRPDLVRYRELLDRTGFDLDPRRSVRTLPLVAQQQVEILRALARDSSIIAMDEPTALLTRRQSEELVRLIRSLADEGRGIVLISHFLDEVLAATDTVTVLRDGQRVSTGPTGEHTQATLVRQMVGREVTLLFPDPAPVPPNADVALEMRGVHTAAVADLSLSVRKGEIVGLAGLVGSGRTEALRAAFGADNRQSGSVRIRTERGGTVEVRSCHGAARAGMAMIPESRKEQGLVMLCSLRENVALASLHSRQRAGLLLRRQERKSVADITRRVDVRGANPTGPVWTLSGGNQQKALFGKWLVTNPTVLLVDEPTRGVDIAAKIEIHRLIVELAAAGMAVVLVSSELEEVLGLSHRVLVMRRGALVAEFDRGADREAVMTAAFGADTRS